MSRNLTTSSLAGSPPPLLVTVRLATPDTPFGALAWICALPAATPLASPPTSTVAIDVLELLQVKVVDTMLPLASRAVALNCCVVPDAMLADVGLTVTVVIGPTGGT